MTTKEKQDLFAHAYTTMEKNGETIHILDTDVVKKMGDQNLLLKMQERLGVGVDASYEIMAEACDIIGEKNLTGNNRDSLVGDDLDFFADADSRANVYTAVQLSYLNPTNEYEISALMKDEAITSIAQACSIWHSQKVAEACEMIREYLIN